MVITMAPCGCSQCKGMGGGPVLWIVLCPKHVSWEEAINEMMNKKEED